jgi:hypothetical protein
MTRPWDEDERAWVIECATAGDDLREIARETGRTVKEVRRVVGLQPMTARQRVVAQGLAAGLTFAQIDAETGGGCARHIARRIRARGYRLPDPRERLFGDDIDQVVRANGLETRTRLAEVLGVPMGSASHWKARGLSRHTLVGVLHVQA